MESEIGAGNRRVSHREKTLGRTFDASPPPRPRSPRCFYVRQTSTTSERAEERAKVSGAECARFARARLPWVAEDRTWNSPVSLEVKVPETVESELSGEREFGLDSISDRLWR